MSKETDFYARLGIPRDATPEEVRRAYREAARRLHPDTNLEPGETELFLRIQEAYEVISDPEKRATYDVSLPAEQVIPPPVTVKIDYSQATLERIDEPQLIYAVLELKANEDEQDALGPPVNVCLVLDCSTSMQGPFLDTVKATSIELIHQLRQQDLLSIVVFNDRAEVLIPSGSHMEHSRIETSIRMLQARGGTEILKGLETGFVEVTRHQRTDYVNHIILLTDGHTYGDEEGCMEIAERAAELSIGISSLGIGDKWNDEFLDKLSTRTGGNCMYVSKPKDIRQFLKEKISSLAKSYASRVALNIETGTGIEIKYVFRMQPESSRLDVEKSIQLGNLSTDTALVVVFEFIVWSVPYQTDIVKLGEGNIILDLPSRTKPTYTMRVNFDRAASNEPDPAPTPMPIMQALSRLTLYRMQERVQEDVAAGKFKEATRRLQYLATNLLAQGERELARTVMVEAAHIQQNHAFSETGEKRIKYGTRNLITSDFDELWDIGSDESIDQHRNKGEIK